MSGSPATAHTVVAIDGPAASGKSSVARELARRLQFAYVNSGAMYRAVTWFVLQQGIAADDSESIATLIDRAEIHCDLSHGESRIVIDGTDPERFLREDRVNKFVSLVSSIPRVRERLVELMRAYARDQDVVIEGRDIGSVVFPDTAFKFYIDASPEVRLQRRQAQGQRDEIAARDRADSSRQASPLVISENAEVIDSSHVSIADVVEQIVEQLKRKGLDLAAKT